MNALGVIELWIRRAKLVPLEQDEQAALANYSPMHEPNGGVKIHERLKNMVSHRIGLVSFFEQSMLLCCIHRDVALPIPPNRFGKAFKQPTFPGLLKTTRLEGIFYPIKFSFRYRPISVLWSSLLFASLTHNEVLS
jgi:hypothetical protein